jgi:quinol-cytochrome oxidoreductase complex cytochrome b subunit
MTETEALHLRPGKARQIFGVLASIFTVPGAGHVFVGQVRRGLVWLALVCAFFLTIPFAGFIGLIATIAAWCGAAVDAVIASRLQRTTPLPNKKRTALVWISLWIVGSLITNSIRANTVIS